MRSFDERRLKAMALAKSRIGPAEWLVKVVPHARTGAAVVTGYVTELKFVAGERRRKWSGPSGLEGRSWRRGASVLWLGRLPDWAEFALREYTQCPGGERYDGHGAYRPVLGVPQSKLLCALPRVSEWSLSRERDCE